MRLKLPSFLCLSLVLSCVIAVAQSTQVVYRFQGGNDGAIPDSNLVPDGAGGFYGLTRTGGSGFCGGFGCGTFFHLSPASVPGQSWTETVLYSFQGMPDVSQPSSGLIADKSGNFYGVSPVGGATNWGTVFELSPPAQSGDPWTETVLYSFTDGLDGGYPEGGLALGNNGSLYGTT